MEPHTRSIHSIPSNSIQSNSIQIKWPDVPFCKKDLNDEGTREKKRKQEKEGRRKGEERRRKLTRAEAQYHTWGCDWLWSGTRQNGGALLRRCVEVIAVKRGVSAKRTSIGLGGFVRECSWKPSRVLNTNNEHRGKRRGEERGDGKEIFTSRATLASDNCLTDWLV